MIGPLDENGYYRLMPRLNGRIRKERWGGTYYSAPRLQIAAINELAYEVYKLCDGSRTTWEVENALLEEYDAPEAQIKSDLLAFLGNAMLRGYLVADGFEVPPPDPDASSNGGHPSPFSDTSFLEGRKVIGLEPNILSAPLKVLTEFTHNCNLRCVHCFADAAYCPQSKPGYLAGELTTDEWRVVIDKLADAEVFDVFVSGGEPLIRKDIFEIMAHIKARGMGFCLLTNATLIDDAVAQRLLDLGCYKVEANLDGPDAQSYDEFRGVAGAFEATVKGIQACLRNGLAIRCNVTSTRKNVYQMKEIVDTAWNIGVRELCAVPLEPGGRGYTNRDDLDFDEQERNALTRYFREVSQWVTQKYGREFLFVGQDDYLLGNRDNTAVKYLANDNMPLCGAGRFHCSIGPTGHAILCPAAGKQLPITPGDVLHDDFRTIWLEGDVFKAVRRVDLPGCSTCEYVTCAGGCRVRTYLKYGTLTHGPDDEQCLKRLRKRTVVD